MRSRSTHIGCWAALTYILLAATPAPLQAEQFAISGQGYQTLALPGAFAGLVKPNGSFYTADPYGLGQSFSIPVILDTGASGSILSAAVAGSTEGFNIPTTGAVYADIGIGGSENFNVSQPTALKLAPMSPTVYSYDMWTDTGVDNTENPAYYSPYGTHNFQIRQSDPMMAGFSMPINIIGTPVINQHVMHVKPNSIPYSSLIPTIDYMETELLSSVPTDLPANTFRVPIAYQNFITSPETVPVTTSTNPMIPNVKVQKGAITSAPSAWLFDSGASITIIGRDMATEIGLNLNDDSYETTIQVGGIGASQPTFFGYRIDHLILPLASGDELTFDSVVIFVPEEGALPADLPGIFGMNLLNQPMEMLAGFPVVTGDSPFSDWYINPGNGTTGELLLVLGPVQAPEPGTFVLLATAATALVLWRRIKRRSAP